MKVNLLKMNFVDKREYFLENQLKEVIGSKHNHLIVIQTNLMPETITYLTNRIRNKTLKHKHRQIKVRIRNKININ